MIRLTRYQLTTVGIIAIVALVAGLIVALATSSRPTPTMPVTGNAVTDCLALAQRDHFAPEICEPLQPGSQINRIDCNNARDPQYAKNNPQDCKS